MRLISHNYSQAFEVGLSASSENPNYRAANIKHEHRSKEWRSSGHFRIDSENGTLLVTGEDPLILDPDSYDTAELVEHINGKLISAGISMAVSCAENSGIWRILNPDGLTIDGTSSLLPVLGFAAIDYAETEVEAGLPAIHTEEHVTFDLKTTEEIDSVVLLWGNGRNILSSDAEVFIQASATANFEGTIFNTQIPIDNKRDNASLYLAEPVSYRFWRVLIKDANNPNQYVNLGVVILGKGMKLDPDNGFEFVDEDGSEITRASFGHEYADKFPIMTRLDFNLSLMPSEEATRLAEIYRRVGTTDPVFVCMDPEEVVFDAHQFSIYGKFGSTLPRRHRFFDVFDTGLSIREVN